MHLFLILKQDFLRLFRINNKISENLILFFLSVFIFSFSIANISYDEAIIERVSVALIWFCLFFAVLFNSGSMFMEDFKDSSLQQYLLYTENLFWLVLSKIISNWLIFCLPIILFMPLITLILDLSLGIIYKILLSSILVSLFFKLICAFCAAIALSPSINKSVLLLIIFPIVIPMIVFANYTIMAGNFWSGMQMITALILFLAPILIFLISEILKISISN